MDPATIVRRVKQPAARTPSMSQRRLGLYVIPDGLHIGGTSRSFRQEARDLIERRIGGIPRGVAGLDGASAESKYRATLFRP
jgi:metal-dependent amidase/aminoacylase/carboxypeptidase family protein